MNNTRREPIKIIKALNSVLIHLYPDYISIVKKQFLRSSEEIVIGPFDKNGKCSVWPKGFMDTNTKAYLELF